MSPRGPPRFGPRTVGRTAGHHGRSGPPPDGVLAAGTVRPTGKCDVRRTGSKPHRRVRQAAGHRSQVRTALGVPPAAGRAGVCRASPHGAPGRRRGRHLLRDLRHRRRQRTLPHLLRPPPRPQPGVRRRGAQGHRGHRAHPRIQRAVPRARGSTGPHQRRRAQRTTHRRPDATRRPGIRGRRDRRDHHRHRPQHHRRGHQHLPRAAAPPLPRPRGVPPGVGSADGRRPRVRRRTHPGQCTVRAAHPLRRARPGAGPESGPPAAAAAAAPAALGPRSPARAVRHTAAPA